MLSLVHVVVQVNADAFRRAVPLSGITIFVFKASVTDQYLLTASQVVVSQGIVNTLLHKKHHEVNSLVHNKHHTSQSDRRREEKNLHKWLKSARVQIPCSQVEVYSSKYQVAEESLCLI